MSIIEGQIDFYYCAKRLKELGYKFNFDETQVYSILSRETGESVRCFENLREVGAFIDGLSEAKNKSKG